MVKIRYDEATRCFGIFDFLRKGKKLDKEVVVRNTLESLLEGGVDMNDIVSFPALMRSKPADFYEHDFICFPIKYGEESKDQVLKKWLDKDEFKFVSDVKKYLSKIEKKTPLVKKRGELVYDADILKESSNGTSKDVESAGYTQVYELNGMYCLIGRDKKEYVFVAVDDVAKWMTADLSFPKSTILEVIDIPMLNGHYISYPKERKKWLMEQLEAYNKIRASRGLPETEFPQVKL